MRLCGVLALCIFSVTCLEITENRVKLDIKYRREDWWEHATFYQIYPRSFKDSNGDGIGDLQGIISKIDFLKEAGISAIWLSPIFKSPQVDQGYDISDYKDIDPDYGTLNDLKELLEKAHKRDIKVILDFVPNHTSDQHVWFKYSVAGAGDYTDFYIWSDGKVIDGHRAPPNNWISNFKGSAWSWNDARGQYYLHQFASAQPDLNYRSKQVVNAMRDVLMYWLDFGVDGFRVDAIPFIYEDAKLRNEPLSNKTGYNSTDYAFLDHTYTFDQEETFQLIYDWRQLLDSYTKTHGGATRVMITEAYSPMKNIIKYYGTDSGSKLGAHFSFNFDFITKLSRNDTLNDIVNIIKDWASNLPERYTFNWVLGNHDNSRVASRLGRSIADGLNMLVSLLPGIQVTYNGEEIGMEDGEVSCEEGKDPMAIKDCTTFDKVSRDFERTPYQWDATTGAGFTDGSKTWLPISSKFKLTNLEDQRSEGVNSFYNIYKMMMEIRRELHKFKEDKQFILEKSNENVLQLYHGNGEYGYNLLFNLGDKTENVQMIAAVEDVNYTVLVKGISSSKQHGDPIDPSSVDLGAFESIVISPANARIINLDNYLYTESSGNHHTLQLFTFVIYFVVYEVILLIVYD